MDFFRRYTSWHYAADYEISRHLWDSMIKVSYQRGYDG